MIKHLCLLLFSLAVSNSLCSETITCTFNWPLENVSNEKQITDFIDASTQSLDISIYQLDNKAIVQSIINAGKRMGSSQIRIVTDSHYFHSDNYTGYKDIASSGIVIVPDDAAGTDRGLCHHKFIIRDKKSVLAGSTNFTENGVVKNNNNLLFFDTPSVVPLFQLEFNQMFEAKLFSTRKKTVPGSRDFKINNTRFSIYFSPYDDIKQKTLDAIETAQHSICFCMFTFTDTDISEALIRKFKQGVRVYGVFDRWQATSSFTAYTTMKDAGIPVKLDKHKGLLHHKFAVIDAGTDSDPVVVTGSFNWTSSANTNNDENVAVFHDPSIASQFLEQVRKNFDDLDSIMNLDSNTQISTNDPVLLISKVSFSDPSGDWVEIYCADDRNNGNGADIGNFYLADDNAFKTIHQPTKIRTGEYLLVLQDKNMTLFDESSSTGGIIRVYCRTTAFNSTDEQIVLHNKNGDIIDAVCWANQNGTFSPGEQEDMKTIFQKGHWSGLSESDCFNSQNFSEKQIITRDHLFTDTNSSQDWTATSSFTRGKTSENTSEKGLMLERLLGL